MKDYELFERIKDRLSFDVETKGLPNEVALKAFEAAKFVSQCAYTTELRIEFIGKRIIVSVIPSSSFVKDVMDHSNEFDIGFRLAEMVLYAKNHIDGYIQCLVDQRDEELNSIKSRIELEEKIRSEYRNDRRY